MRIHFIVEPASAGEFVALGRLAESFGFDALWTANHAGARDPFVSFAPLAQQSRRLKVGPVAVSPFELHPLKMANALLALHELAGGRAQLVVGGGGGTLIAMHLKPGRSAMFPRMVRGVRECVEFLRAAATGEAVDFAGEVFEVSGYHAPWAAALPPPALYVGATRPQMLSMAARLADGIMFSDLPEGRLAETLARIDATLADAGRPRDALRLNNLFAWHVKPDPAAAAAEARRKLWVRGMVGRWYISPFLEPAEVDRVENNMAGIIHAYRTNTPDIDDLPRPLVDKLVDELTFCGGPGDVDRLVERLWTFKRAGIDEMGLRLYDDPAESIRLVAERIGPELR